MKIIMHSKQNRYSDKKSSMTLPNILNSLMLPFILRPPPESKKKVEGLISMKEVHYKRKYFHSPLLGGSSSYVNTEGKYVSTQCGQPRCLKLHTDPKRTIQ